MGAFRASNHHYWCQFGCLPLYWHLKQLPTWSMIYELSTHQAFMSLLFSTFLCDIIQKLHQSNELGSMKWPEPICTRTGLRLWDSQRSSLTTTHLQVNGIHWRQQGRIYKQKWKLLKKSLPASLPPFVFQSQVQDEIGRLNDSGNNVESVTCMTALLQADSQIKKLVELVMDRWSL